MAEWIKVGEVGSPAPGQIQVITPRGERIALANVDGEYYAIDDVCTHDGGALDQGELDGPEIECPRHGARFDVRTGKVTQLPAFSPVETFPVRIQDGTVLVDVED